MCRGAADRTWPPGSNGALTAGRDAWGARYVGDPEPGEGEEWAGSDREDSETEGEEDEAASLRRQAAAIQHARQTAADEGDAGSSFSESDSGGPSSAPHGAEAAAGAACDAASEASTAVLRREVGAAAAARQRKGGDMEVRCARPGCGEAEPLLARRREKMKKCSGCRAVYYSNLPGKTTGASADLPELARKSGYPTSLEELGPRKFPGIPS